MTTVTNLPTFDDRFTMHHTREYPHPIEDVFAAITTTEDLNAWMLPTVEVEPRLGGRCAFTWGGPRSSPMVGTIKEFDPPRLVHYDLLGSFLRFELESLDASRTRLTLLHRIDRPGIETLGLWPPDVVLGFHDMVDALGDVLDGTRDIDLVRQMIEAADAGRFEEWTANIPHEWREERARAMGVYREHILSQCPPDDPAVARQPTALEAAVRDKSDDEINAWAASSGGMDAVCDLVFKEMRARLSPRDGQHAVIAYDLGGDLQWVIEVADGDAAVARRTPTEGTTTVHMTATDLLRVVANDLEGATAMMDGRIKIDGDRDEFFRFYGMTRRGQ